MPRTGTGKTVTKRLRAEGLVPGILFGPGDDHGELLQMPKEDVERLVRIYGLSGIARGSSPSITPTACGRRMWWRSR